MNADPVCVAANKTPQTQETYIVSEAGELGNVFVYVQAASAIAPSRRPRPLRDRSAGCRYHPHVFGVMVGQPLAIVNSDATLHNIHAMPK